MIRIRVGQQTNKKYFNNNNIYQPNKRVFSVKINSLAGIRFFRTMSIAVCRIVEEKDARSMCRTLHSLAIDPTIHRPFSRFQDSRQTFQDFFEYFSVFKNFFTQDNFLSVKFIDL